MDIDDDKNDKLVIKPALPQGQAHSPHSTSGVSLTIFINDCSCILTKHFRRHQLITQAIFKRKVLRKE